MSAPIKGAGLTFEVRAAKTVRLGPLFPALPAAPGQAFAAREAGTVVLPPPHWAGLSQSNPETAGEDLDPRPAKKE